MIISGMGFSDPAWRHISVQSERFEQRLYNEAHNHRPVWLGRGAWRALHPKSSIRGGDSRGRPRWTHKPI